MEPMPQRQKYKNGNLPEEQLNKLNGLDVTWQEKTTISTSFPEQTILFYIQKLFPDAKKYKSKSQYKTVDFLSN